MEDTNEQVTTEIPADGETSATETVQAETPVTEAAEAFAPDDAMLERAVKAGMSLADAKALPSKEFAERMLSALEGKPTTGNNGGSGNAAGGDEIPAIDFTDFGEDHGYDPNLSRAMNSLKATVEAQAKAIAKLKAGMSPSKPSAKAVEARKNLTLARPGGEGGTRRGTPESSEAEILSALRSKFKLD